jgi:uncharacterized membrane protein YadS
VRGLLRALLPPWASLRQAAPGVAAAIVLALIARSIAAALGEGAVGLPRFPLSPVMCAVVLGMLWRNTLGVPAWATNGLRWAMHQLLRAGIALVGLRLTLSGASSIALTALPVVAMSPVIRARHAETAFAVTCVVLFGCAAMLCYPWVAGHFFAASPVHAGIFLGTAIHDTSQVIGAALMYSQQAGAPAALAAASVAKLLRNLSIAILVPLAAWLVRRHESQAAAAGHAVDREHAGLAPHPQLVPMFVLAFLGFIVVRSAGDSLLGAHNAPWQALVNTGYTASDLFLTCGMTAVGLSVAFNDMWRIGWRPLAAGFAVASLVGACSLTLTLALLHYV